MTIGANSGSSTAPAGESGSSLLDQARQQVQPVIQQTGEKAGQLMDQARLQLNTQMTGQKENLAGTLDRLAGSLRQTGQGLQQNEQGMMAPYLTSAAEQIERVSRYLHDRELNELVVEAEQLARSQPAMFLMGAFALGFLASRFFKSSAAGNGAGTQPGMSGSTASWQSSLAAGAAPGAPASIAPASPATPAPAPSWQPPAMEDDDESELAAAGMSGAGVGESGEG